MKVILLDKMENLGEMGDVVDVADGYARNYLIPRGIAQPATKARMARIEEEIKRRQLVSQEEEKAARQVAEKLEGTMLEVMARAGGSGKLFGSVTTSDIAEHLRAATGEMVNRRKILLSEPLRDVGEYEVEIALHPEVRLTIQVRVKAQE